MLLLLVLLLLPSPAVAHTPSKQSNSSGCCFTPSPTPTQLLILSFPLGCLYPLHLGWHNALLSTGYGVYAPHVLVPPLPSYTPHPLTHYTPPQQATDLLGSTCS